MLDKLFKRISFWFLNIKHDVKVKNPIKPLFSEPWEINEEGTKSLFEASSSWNKIVSELPTFEESNNPSLIKLHNNNNNDLIETLKQATKIEVKKYKSELTIIFKNGKELTWINTSNSNSKNNFPWSDLYKWYFSKTTLYFCFNSVEGDIIFNREDIMFIYRSKTIKEIE